MDKRFTTLPRHSHNPATVEASTSGSMVASRVNSATFSINAAFKGAPSRTTPRRRQLIGLRLIQQGDLLGRRSSFYFCSRCATC